jgi:uncharacterized protein YaeQ
MCDRSMIRLFSWLQHYSRRAALTRKEALAREVHPQAWGRQRAPTDQE